MMCLLLYDLFISWESLLCGTVRAAQMALISGKKEGREMFGLRQSKIPGRNRCKAQEKCHVPRMPSEQLLVDKLISCRMFEKLPM